MRVLHSCGTWLSLTENWIHTSVSFLPPHVETAVVCDLVANRETYADVSLYTRPPSGRLHKALEAARYLASGVKYRGSSHLVTKSAREFGAQLIHSHFGPRGWRDSGAALKVGAKHAVTFYGSDANVQNARHTKWGNRYKDMFRHVGLVVCEGPALAEKIRLLGCAPDKVAVNHLGVDLTRYEYRPRAWDPREELRILVAGRFTEKKGIPDALEAIALVRKRVPLHVTLIGDAGPSQEQQAEKARILATISRLGLQSCVTLAGLQPHSDFLEAAYQHHIFLSPSLTPASGDTEGGLPVSFLELAASGMPIISTRHADIPELLEDRHSGFLSDERDPPALAASIEWMLGDRGRWGDVCLAARKVVEREFNAEIQGRKLAALYSGLL